MDEQEMLKIAVSTATTANTEVFEVILKVKLIVDYDEPAYLITTPKKLRGVSEDVNKVKLVKKGQANVSVMLVRLKPGLTHKEVKQTMFNKGIAQAGLHELIHFAHFLEELFREGLRITSLRDEMFEMGVEFIPTICCNKKSAMLIMAFRDDLPFKDTYFLGIEEEIAAAKN
ncbi:MAG: hypothetical protein ACYC40_00555 [Patescibacteria group bacterium]